MPRKYDVTIERKVRSTFTVTAVSRTDAAVQVAGAIAIAESKGQDPFGSDPEVDGVDFPRTIEVKRVFGTPIPHELDPIDLPATLTAVDD